jgi:GNAT superfamily N-acetyltransferase
MSSPSSAALSSPSSIICGIEEPLGRRSVLGGSLNSARWPSFSVIQVTLSRSTPVFVAQDAADPQRRGLGVGAHAHLLAFDVLRVHVAEVAVEAGAVVLEAARDRRRQQHVGLAVGFRLQEGDDRQFAGVEERFRAPSP